jgi:hypothetical protein
LRCWIEMLAAGSCTLLFGAVHQLYAHVDLHGISLGAARFCVPAVSDRCAGCAAWRRAQLRVIRQKLRLCGAFRLQVGCCMADAALVHLSCTGGTPGTCCGVT